MNYLDLETMTSRQVSWDQLIEMCAIELADRNLTKCLACVQPEVAAIDERMKEFAFMGFRRIAKGEEMSIFLAMKILSMILV